LSVDSIGTKKKYSNEVMGLAAEKVTALAERLNGTRKKGRNFHDGGEPPLSLHWCRRPMESTAYTSVGASMRRAYTSVGSGEPSSDFQCTHTHG